MARLTSVSLRRSATLVAAMAVLALTAGALAYPKPARVPIRWELTFQPGPLRLYVDRAGGGQAYWYFTYKVTNLTGQDRFWAPRVTLFADTGEITDGGEGVPPSVEMSLIELLGNPFLQRQNQVIGKIFVGHDNAIEGLVVWPAHNLQATELSVFVSGISGETAEVNNPVTGQRIVLQKTLQRNYVVPGDPLSRRSTPVELASEDWVMR
ncbi:MAG: hypothetical protein HRU76_09315 [Phycisphaeraceae bacterium]|nr:hypothetical protein [Phycisphaerales bacterium]QOJ17769.1 MAG: hypothetical protein HRU76_09315 [Phycisphaeraceae bacterium]